MVVLLGAGRPGRLVTLDEQERTRVDTGDASFVPPGHGYPRGTDGEGMGMSDDGTQDHDELLVADLVVQRLRAWGVPRVFGYSGDGINTFMGALRRAGGDPALVQARHEEAAALMAVGHAKYTGGVGVMTSTQGPGAGHLLKGLDDAKLDHVPVVAIVGQIGRA